MNAILEKYCRAGGDANDSSSVCPGGTGKPPSCRWTYPSSAGCFGCLRRRTDEQDIPDESCSSTCPLPKQWHSLRHPWDERGIIHGTYAAHGRLGRRADYVSQAWPVHGPLHNKCLPEHHVWRYGRGRHVHTECSTLDQLRHGSCRTLARRSVSLHHAGSLR